MRLHPTDTDHERLIWPAAANTESGVIVSVWGGANAASANIGLPPHWMRRARLELALSRSRRQSKLQFQLVLRESIPESLLL